MDGLLGQQIDSLEPFMDNDKMRLGEDFDGIDQFMNLDAGLDSNLDPKDVGDIDFSQLPIEKPDGSISPSTSAFDNNDSNIIPGLNMPPHSRMDQRTPSQQLPKFNGPPLNQMPDNFGQSSSSSSFMNQSGKMDFLDQDIAMDNIDEIDTISPNIFQRNSSNFGDLGNTNLLNRSVDTNVPGGNQIQNQDESAPDSGSSSVSNSAGSISQNLNPKIQSDSSISAMLSMHRMGSMGTGTSTRTQYRPHSADPTNSSNINASANASANAAANAAAAAAAASAVSVPSTNPEDDATGTNSKAPGHLSSPLHPSSNNTSLNVNGLMGPMLGPMGETAPLPRQGQRERDHRLSESLSSSGGQPSPAFPSRSSFSSPAQPLFPTSEPLIKAEPRKPSKRAANRSKSKKTESKIKTMPSVEKNKKANLMRERLRYILAINQELIKIAKASPPGSPQFAVSITRLKSNIGFIRTVQSKNGFVLKTFALPPPLLGPIQDLPMLNESYTILERLFHANHQ